MKEELRNVLDHMGLTLSEAKTKVTHITEGFQFLGYWIITQHREKGEDGTKGTHTRGSHQKVSPQSTRNLAPSTSKESVTAKITAVNRLTRGWCEYYSCTSSPSKVFRKIDDELFWDMAHWLGRKYKASMPEIMQGSERKTFRNQTVKLLKPTEYKAKKLLVKTWHNPYTGQEKIKQRTAVLL